MSIDNPLPILNVTQPTLPPLDEFIVQLRDIWDRKWLTNNGPYHQQFESALAQYLGVKHVSLFCNGMIALQVGLQALEVTGEVITTPFSFPATTHAIHWNHCTPVFCDIEPETCNLDPACIEALITSRTTCILPVHVYGNPCNVDDIMKISEKHGCKVFFDAAHAFGVRMNGESLLKSGHLSMLSFHATKVFNTIEGGALITNDSKLKERIDFLKNFGFSDETTVIEPGTNGKMNEIQAAYGLLQLKYIDSAIAERRAVAGWYRRSLAGIPGIRFFEDTPGVTQNYSYFPIFIDEHQYGMTRDDLYWRLKEQRINGRRYFYPLISSFPMYTGLPSASSVNLPEANIMAERVLCLPIHTGLRAEDLSRVVQVVLAHKEDRLV